MKISGDPNNVESCSSQIIISNLNKGAKAIGLFSDDGEVVVYDCLANNHGFDTNHIICPYETSIPSLVVSNAGGRNLIGVSCQNQMFFTEGGYPSEKTDYFSLGVDSKIWRQMPKEKSNKFRFGMMCDSNTRAAYQELLTAFGAVFSGNREVSLYIKDRWATPTFKQFVKELSISLDIEVIHDDTHITDKNEEVKIYNNIDCMIFLNKSSTFALTVIQAMAMNIPMITMDYSGPRDYCSVKSAFLVDFKLEEVTRFTISQLSSIGLRNYLILPDQNDFVTKPTWAVPNYSGIKAALLKAYENKHERELRAHNGMVTAQSMTWEKAAANLAYIVYKKTN